ncbi:hypothetical protein [Kitasatospora herbaricolor]|uniref:Uncharacterized protein n=1 Tax=Kitasatospora herbaricolor TaxID=68217 RepID=A0ABZ1W0F3_9ACTN|nr:hypothetical protein [Kitasatospora herbaricolor]
MALLDDRGSLWRGDLENEGAGDAGVQGAGVQADGGALGGVDLAGHQQAEDRFAYHVFAALQAGLPALGLLEGEACGQQVQDPREGGADLHGEGVAGDREDRGGAGGADGEQAHLAAVGEVECGGAASAGGGQLRDPLPCQGCRSRGALGGRGHRGAAGGRQRDLGVADGRQPGDDALGALGTAEVAQLLDELGVQVGGALHPAVVILGERTVQAHPLGWLRVDGQQRNPVAVGLTAHFVGHLGPVPKRDGQSCGLPGDEEGHEIGEVPAVAQARVVGLDDDDLVACLVAVGKVGGGQDVHAC